MSLISFRTKSVFGLILAACAALGLPSTAAKQSERKDVPIIPREVLLGNPDVTSVSLSPDGESIAFMAPHNDILGIWVRDLAGKKTTQATYVRLR